MKIVGQFAKIETGITQLNRVWKETICLGNRSLKISILGAEMYDEWSSTHDLQCNVMVQNLP